MRLRNIILHNVTFMATANEQIKKETIPIVNRGRKQSFNPGQSQKLKFRSCSSNKKDSVEVEIKTQLYLENLKQAGAEIKKKRMEQNQKENFVLYKKSKTLEDEEDFFKKQFFNEKYRLKVGVNAKILSCRYDPTDNYIASGSDDGYIRIFSESKGLLQITIQDPKERLCPVTAVRWNPNKNLPYQLISCYTNGMLIYWKTLTGEVLQRYYENENTINSCDFNFDGTKFVSVGNDTKVRIYDASKKGLPDILQSGIIPKHKNRVYAVKFLNDNQQVLMSAGWDQNVLIWDLRQGQAVSFISGPMICGDSLDYRNNQVLTGSWRKSNQLQIWDLRKTKLEMELPWENIKKKGQDEDIQTYIYSCQFGKKLNEDYIVGGSTGTYELRLFQKQDNNYQCVDGLKDLFEKGIYTTDFSNSHTNLVYGSGDGTLGCVSIL